MLIAEITHDCRFGPMQWLLWWAASLTCGVVFLLCFYLSGAVVEEWRLSRKLQDIEVQEAILGCAFSRKRPKKTSFFPTPLAFIP